MTRTPLAPANPAVLRWAREDAGLSPDDVGRMAQVDGERVRAWEVGDAQPTLGQLRRVADGLRRTVAFFFTPTVPAEHSPHPPDFRSVSGSISPRLRREIRAAHERREAYLDLMRDVRGAGQWATWREQPPPTSADVRTRLGVLPEDIAEAMDARAALKVWIRAVEAQGVLVFQMSGIPVAECRGISLDHPESPVIVLNGSDAPQARSFTLLHEFGHLLDHTGGLCLLDERRDVERRCNRFAAEVLMPRAEVTRTARASVVAERVDDVARAFRVSALAAGIRLRDLRLISQDVLDDVIRETEAARLRTEDRRTGGPAPDVLKRRNLGEPYVEAVLDALHRDEITVLDATNFLDTKVSVLEKLERGPSGARR